MDINRFSQSAKSPLKSPLSFGGGFEITKAGGDIGLWTPLKSGICLSAVTAHIPIRWTNSHRNRGTEVKERIERLRMGANKKDLFYHLSGEELPESERPSPTDVAKDGLLVIIAGSDTTCSVLTAVLYYLLCNPAAFERLQAEVDGAFPSGEEPLDVAELSANLEELNSAATNSNESLRPQPPVLSGSQRRAGKGKGTKYLEI
ncbi:hypothetical protein EDB84DRAFT_1485366, partial [Lactarius hengduanensis]